eukprot:TRINITY_DN3162_c1_g1_i1.p6 TRINITY_DN3162_c1_g1~~TRINITY_DN3162_c1_g1_i1.p6  ORF type:complete len:100 (-),score=1.30 TRINITY_DN3162_c1_g1_i1:689-988(-)
MGLGFVGVHCKGGGVSKGGSAAPAEAAGGRGGGSKKGWAGQPVDWDGDKSADGGGRAAINALATALNHKCRGPRPCPPVAPAATRKAHTPRAHLTHRRR